MRRCSNWDFRPLDQLRLKVPKPTRLPRHRVLDTGASCKGRSKKKGNKTKFEPLYYLDPTGETTVLASPTALFFPMLSAFRAYLKKEGNRYAWLDGKSPLQWPEDEFFQVCQRLAVKIGRAAYGKSSLHDVGRDEGVWNTCYETLNGELLANGRKKKHA